MLIAHIQTAYRYLKAHKFIALINITGITTGLCVFYFALLYISFESSYDTFNTKYNRIYRLVTDVQHPTGTNYESAAASMAPTIQRTIPQIEATARVFLDDYIFLVNGKNYGTVSLAYADSSIFNIFSFPIVSGNPETFLTDPFSAVLSVSAAKKYFNTVDCIGQIIMLNGEQPARVTGVMEDIPLNSHLRSDVFLSMSTLLDTRQSYFLGDWNRYGFYTYVLLHKNADANLVAHQLPEIIRQYSSAKSVRQQVTLEPLKDVYLNGKPRGFKAGSTLHGTSRNLYVFTAVAILVLLIACFNFVNLTTAFSIYRSKEISIRKVLGAGKSNLVLQFLTDAVLISTASFILAMALSQLLLPVFNHLTGKIISKTIFDQPFLIAVLFGVSLCTGLLSGIYPAIILSSYPPVHSTSNTASSGFQLLRKSLIVLQFSISMLIILSLVVISKQLYFMQHQELGFKKQHLLVIDFQFNDQIRMHTATIKNALYEIPGIKSASFSAYFPGKQNKKYPLTIVNSSGESNELQTNFYFVDNDFFNQYGITVLAGHLFTGSDSINHQSMVVNESMMKSLGYSQPGELIGKRYSQRFVGTIQEGTITAVVKDFHYASYADPIQPLAIRTLPVFYTFLSLSVASDDMSKTIATIEKKWRQMAPTLPISYFFADEAYDNQYNAEARFKKLFTCFAVLAVILSCLGLLGLSIHASASRAKEIAIRKTLGASFVNILRLVTRDIVVLIIVSFFIAIPLGWMIMNNWLDAYAYKISLSWQIFFVTGTVTLFIGLLSVSTHAIKSALTNPIKALKE